MSARAIALLAGFATSLMAVAAPEAPAVTTDRPLVVMATLGAAQAMFHSQMLGELDHPVGEAIAVAGTTVAARLGDEGQLELDLTGMEVAVASKPWKRAWLSSTVGARRMQL